MLFFEFSEIINRIFILDLKRLNSIYEDKYKNVGEISEKYRLDRLTSLGLIKSGNKSKYEEGALILDNDAIDKTIVGEKLYKMII